jgi:hypothetical protein
LRTTFTIAFTSSPNFVQQADEQRNQLILAVWCNNNSFSSCDTLSKSCLPIGDGNSEAVIGLRQLSRLLASRSPPASLAMPQQHADLFKVLASQNSGGLRRQFRSRQSAQRKVLRAGS